MKKIRLDAFLAEKGLSQSREKGRREIIAGWVKVNGETFRDPSKKITGDENVTVERPGGIFVSRGGDKLKKALDYFSINLKGKITLDLGASTGGFTDCMLKNGAAKVYAVDVGYNQLDYSLRTDSRVVVMEKTHARDINSSMFSEKIDFFTADLSFISVLKILPSVAVLFSGIEGVILLKPQFEAESSQQKKGVVRSEDNHVEILTRVIEGIIKTGFSPCGITFSPIKGPAGNIEFLVYLKRGHENDFPVINIDKTYIQEIVKSAHNELD
ncbi:MAG TPA: TlyA family RNA methyltransferase [Spirochaetota bacterium]|nr:TlyA family RNA methyltransferase [Spirochaetota bacterium]HPF06050.1 TlyA family RNA methyltransferase [Spirochaetota bacterium]HPJ42396.1 TlyA family RNA methyltransferase [Spirochaetota bacterium]HPR37317.1 TlyA family RNA methyltransferase [Spirochaetota bacterium]HRX46703.1 TlyA family RNA methyltransferase [Spirochaetota bacterium]